MSVQRLNRLQKRISLDIQKRVAARIGETPESIRKYEREFERDFAPALRAQRNTFVPFAELVQEVRRSRVTWIGDFHTFAQSQRTALRIIRSVVKKGEPWVIGLEMVPSHLQAELDAFQSGKISLERFHEAIDYATQWGFPWEHYRPLFEWAQERRVRLLALNLPRAFPQGLLEGPKATMDLDERDRWASGIITDALSPRADSRRPTRAIVLYGEMHVARSHLPAKLEAVSRAHLGEKIESTVIHQNHARLYWKAASQRRLIENQILRLSPKTYCVFSGTPWTRSQSLLSWIEGEHELEQDFLSEISVAGHAIAEFMELSTPKFESLEVRSAQDTKWLKKLIKSPKLTPMERRLVKWVHQHSERLWIPAAVAGTSDVAFLSNPSLNGASEMAAIHLLRAKSRCALLAGLGEDEFWRQVNEQTWAFACSLIVNPKRKCDLKEDHEIRLRLAQNKTEAQARRITLKLLNEESPSASLAREFQGYRGQPELWQAARYLGSIYGMKLHRAILNGTVSALEIQNALLVPYSKSRGKNALIHTWIRKQVESIRLVESKRALL